MKYNFFAIPAKNPKAAQEEFNAFCVQHRVAFVEKQLIADGGDSFWSICVSWEEGEAAPSVSEPSKRRVDYKKVLSEEDFDHYLELHHFRRELAELNSVPPYAPFNNEQMAEMVKQRMKTKADLKKLPGVGESRIEKYGDDFVKKLNELWADNETDQNKP